MLRTSIVNLEQYIEKTSDYLSSLNADLSASFHLLETLRNKLSHNTASLIISNIHKHKKNDDYYIFKLDRSAVEILDVKGEEKTRIFLPMDKEEAYLNDQSVSKKTLNLSPLFIQIVSDLKTERSKIYEERV